MDFEFTEDQLELRDNARSVLAGACPPSLVRAVYDGDTSGVEGLWKTLVDLGWPAIGVDEASGGLGLSFVETGLVVEELGRVVAPTPFLATVTQFLPFVRGHAALAAQVAEGAITGAAAVWGRVEVQRGDDAWILNGEKRNVIDGATADHIAVVVDGGVVVVPQADVVAVPLRTIDPTTALAHVRFENTRVPVDRIVIPPGAGAARAVARAMDEAYTGMALSTVATCRRIFEMTLEYTKLREQFGKPIGSFQAVKHRMADMYLAVEKASALAYFAALTIAEDDPRRSMAAAMAKASAGDCQRLLARDGLQLHGGIGFTWENDLHFWLKRAKTGDALFGNAAYHRARVAQDLGLAS